MSRKPETGLTTTKNNSYPKGRELIKAAKLALALLPALVFLSAGCGRSGETSETASKNGQPASTTTQRQTGIFTNGQGDVITATRSDPRTGIRTKLGEFSFDFDRDGDDEKIELYTQAERAEDGKIIWDDGQDWLLVVIDGDDYYPLFDSRIQLGSLYFGVWQENNAPVISSAVITSAGAALKNFIYDSAQKGYKAQNGFDTGGINLLHSSIPSY